MSLSALTQTANTQLQRLPLQVAGLLILLISSGLILMHSAILLGVLSAEHIWGGHAADNATPWAALSLLLNGSALLVGVSYLWPQEELKRFVALFHVPLAWFLVGNTLFNVVLLPSFEGLLGTPTCAILALGLWRGLLK